MRNPAKRVAVVFGAAFALLCVALVVQDQRHGWPFSRHHGVSTPLPSSANRAVEVAGSAHDRAPVSLDGAGAAALGMTFEPARLEVIAEPVRAVATVVADEARIAHVHTRVSGWVEELHVSTTGERIEKGQPLASVFSQELYSSQTEYLTALRHTRAGPDSVVVNSARTRLRVLGMSEAEIAALERGDQPRRLVTVPSPIAGVVLHRGVTTGTAVDPSTEIATIVDLSTVWVLAEVPEEEASRLAQGSPARLSFPATGRGAFPAAVEFVYPTLTERTRTVRVRFVVPNADGRLRPGLYGTAELAAPPRETLTIPRDAVVDTGESQHVFVQSAAGVLEPRTVRVGARLGERVEIVAGLSSGEPVLTTGVFLIDSESRLRASGAASGHAGHGAPAETEKPKEERQPQHSRHGS